MRQRVRPFVTAFAVCAGLLFSSEANAGSDASPDQWVRFVKEAAALRAREKERERKAAAEQDAADNARFQIVDTSRFLAEIRDVVEIQNIAVGVVCASKKKALIGQAQDLVHYVLTDEVVRQSAALAKDDDIVDKDPEDALRTVALTQGRLEGLFEAHAKDVRLWCAKTKADPSMLCGNFKVRRGEWGLPLVMWSATDGDDDAAPVPLVGPFLPEPEQTATFSTAAAVTELGRFVRLLDEQQTLIPVIVKFGTDYQIADAARYFPSGYVESRVADIKARDLPWDDPAVKLVKLHTTEEKLSELYAKAGAPVDRACAARDFAKLRAAKDCMRYVAWRQAHQPH